MKKILFLLLLIPVLGFSQNIYKQLSNEMSIQEALEEFENNRAYKYENIKLGDFPHLFDVGGALQSSLLRNLETKSIDEWGKGLFEGLLHNGKNLVGVQLNTKYVSFKNIYDEAEQLTNFFQDKSYDIDTSFGKYLRKELEFSEFGEAQLLVLKKGELFVSISVSYVKENEMCFQLILFNEKDKDYFKNLFGVPEYVDDGF